LGGERVITIRHMEASELDRIREIDRSEHVTQEYSYRRGSLEKRTVDVVVPTWSRSGDNEHSVQGRVNAWQPILDRGGTLVGAVDADTLAGFAIYQPHLAEGMANLSVLHVAGTTGAAASVLYSPERSLVSRASTTPDASTFPLLRAARPSSSTGATGSSRQTSRTTRFSRSSLTTSI
jgi:hypothetical protein